MSGFRHAKYRNIKTVVDGLSFDSKGEAKRWQELVLLEKAGEISALRRQVRIPLHAHGKKICAMVADFEYHKDGKRVVEDFKSPATITPIFRLKAKLFAAEYGFEVIISGAAPKPPKQRQSRKKAQNR